MAKKLDRSDEAPSSGESAVAAELMTRLTRLHRNATRASVGGSLGLALFTTWWAVGDLDVAHRGILFAKTVGITGGVTFSAVFLSSLTLSFVLSRAWMRRTAEAARCDAVTQHKLPADALLWVVAMFSPVGKGMGFEDDLRSPPSR